MAAKDLGYAAGHPVEIGHAVQQLIEVRSALVETAAVVLPASAAVRYQLAALPALAAWRHQVSAPARSPRCTSSWLRFAAAAVLPASAALRGVERLGLGL